MPFRKGEGGRRKGSPNKATKEIRAFSAECIEDPAYVAALKRRLKAGKAPHMETLLFHYRYGKPKDRIEIEGAAPMPLVIELITDRSQLGTSDPDDGGDPDDTVQ